MTPLIAFILGVWVGTFTGAFTLHWAAAVRTRDEERAEKHRQTSGWRR